MTIRRICDVCEETIPDGEAFCQDFSWTQDIYTPLEYHMYCYNQKRQDRLNAINELPDSVDEIEPPLDYNVYWEDEYICKAGTPMKEKINIMYDMTPTMDERYN